MTFAELLERVKSLSSQEREEVKKLINTLDASQEDAPYDASEHWGKNLLQLLDEIGPIEMVHPEIDDPVEWVKTIRREERQRRLGNWGDETDTEDSAE